MATETKPRLKPQRPKNDAYVGLLAISLLALLTGCVLLYLDYSQYGTQKPPNAPAAPKSSATVTLPDSTPQPADKTEPSTEAPKTETPTNPMPSTPPAETTPPTTPPAGGSASGLPTGKTPFKPSGSGNVGSGQGTAPTKPAK